MRPAGAQVFCQTGRLPRPADKKCHERFLAGAITVWKKSLELNPSQPELKQKLAAIQDKIKEN